jgi:hypothetical protein
VSVEAGSCTPVADDAAIGLDLPTIVDEHMKGRLRLVRDYTLMILRKTSRYKRPEVDPIIWEHGRRNMALQDAGLMPIVCPIRDDGEFAGIGILTVPPDRVAEILSQDPGVKAGIFTFEVHPVGGFPGSALPIETHAAADASAFVEMATTGGADE